MNTRKSIILELLAEEELVNVHNLAERFFVSEMTIRRDLDELEKQGLVVRTRGGAVSTGRLRSPGNGLESYSETLTKSAIGNLAASLVAPGQTVMVDTGTTALEVARHLPKDSGITVVTTSLLVAQELFKSHIKVLMLAGFLREEFPSVYGPLTVKLLNDMHVDTLFIGCDGADSERGFYSNDLHVSSLEQAMTKIASHVVVATESTKFGRRAFSRYAELQQVNTVVTDAKISASDRQNLEAEGISVMTV